MADERSFKSIEAAWRIVLRVFNHKASNLAQASSLVPTSKFKNLLVISLIYIIIAQAKRLALLRVLQFELFEFGTNEERMKEEYEHEIQIL
ncbi:MAG: hypothetical protein BGO68_03755 [Candidatus Amoebophilus sp. 36-38]|nr:MAG: hypothetical protein BGO68_03755 [Candidatus Amoebophilus sp. 36-38]